MKENSIEEDIKILEEIIKGNEDCINAIYSQMKVKNDNDEDIQYFKKEIQSIENIVNNYLKEKARADKLEKEYSIMLSQLDEKEINYKRVLKENEILNKKIDLMENYMVENGWEICFDNIYAELNNCNGMERDWCRGDELEKEDIHKYFNKKLLESE